MRRLGAIPGMSYAFERGGPVIIKKLSAVGNGLGLQLDRFWSLPAPPSSRASRRPSQRHSRDRRGGTAMARAGRPRAARDGVVGRRHPRGSTPPTPRRHARVSRPVLGPSHAPRASRVRPPAVCSTVRAGRAGASAHLVHIRQRRRFDRLFTFAEEVNGPGRGDEEKTPTPFVELDEFSGRPRFRNRGLSRRGAQGGHVERHGARRSGRTIQEDHASKRAATADTGLEKARGTCGHG